MLIRARTHRTRQDRTGQDRSDGGRHPSVPSVPRIKHWRSVRQAHKSDVLRKTWFLISEVRNLSTAPKSEWQKESLCDVDGTSRT